MLYELWTKIASARGGELALRDAGSGRAWTFAQLYAEGELRPAESGPILFPQGNGPEFIFTLLSAWRAGKIACPLESSQAQPEISLPPDGCVHLKCTSGTSEGARFVAFKAEQLAADAAQIVAAMGLRPNWPNVGVISLAHSYGFSNLILPLLLHGIPLVLAPAPLPEIVRESTARDCTVAAVPALWRAWHEAGCISPKIRLAISAGAPLPLNLENAVFNATGVKIHNFYGASECGGIAFDATATPRRDPALAGTPMPAVKLSLSENGSLVVRGPTVGETYWPGKTCSLNNGTFESSDLAEITESGVFLRGRATDQINVAGRKVCPEAIERVLTQHPRVKDCLVFGIAAEDASRTETIVAMVVSSATEKELKQFLLESIPAWQAPRHWKFVDSLCAGPRGKISRAECRAKFKI